MHERLTHVYRARTAYRADPLTHDRLLEKPIFQSLRHSANDWIVQRRDATALVQIGSCWVLRALTFDGCMYRASRIRRVSSDVTGGLDLLFTVGRVLMKCLQNALLIKYSRSYIECMIRCAHLEVYASFISPTKLNGIFVRNLTKSDYLWNFNL